MTPEIDAPESTQNAPAGEAKPDAPADPVAARAESLLSEAAAIDAEPRRGRGRPPGSKDSRKRTRSGRTARAEAAPEPPAPPAEPTEAEIAGLAGMLATGWRMLGARLRRRPLTPDEARQLAHAAHPVMVKYGGNALEQWGAEIGLGMTMIGLWGLTELPPEPITTDEGEVFHLGGAAS